MDAADMVDITGTDIVNVIVIVEMIVTITVPNIVTVTAV